jgi:arylsulfatase A-like enzyme
MRRITFGLGLVLLGSGGLCAATAGELPRLVVQVTVDQMRGDALPRLRGRFGEGGFRRLLEEGVVYAQANYRHSTTFTAVGHATLFTGAGPNGHGLVGNSWIDPQTGEEVYCVEDSRHQLFGARTSAHSGTSPRNLVGGTWGDELVESSGGTARVLSVSIKDRGAILPGGKLGLACWYSKSTGRFVTSSFYAESLPGWLADWNAAHPPSELEGLTWELLQPIESYHAGGRDDRPGERPPVGFDRSFPHELGAERAAALLAYTPFGDERTVDLALAGRRALELGEDEVTDLLAISLSCTDYIGHAFGPGSLEAEDNLLRLDRTLARLFRALDDEVGAGSYLVVLSSDHGCDRVPEERHAAHCGSEPPVAEGWHSRRAGSLLLERDGDLCCGVGRHYPSELFAAAEAEARRALGVEPGGASWVLGFTNPCLYLDRAALGECGVDRATAADALARALELHPGIARAATRDDLLAGAAGDRLLAMMARSFRADRSGDVMLTPAPYWFLYPDPLEDAAMHGSAHRYDTHVPLIFWGAGVGEAATLQRSVGPEDLAPTLAALLGIEAPPACDGAVLLEVLGGR